MTDASSSITVVAALRLECQAIERGLGGRACVVVTGIGAERATARVERLLREQRPSLLLHVGFAGGLDPALKPGDVLRIGRVISESGDRIELDGTDGRAVLLTADSVADSPAKKAELFRSHLASAVDMETYYVARLAQQAGVKMVALRAISDAAHTMLPAACVNWVTHEGESRPLAAVTYMLTRPWHIPELVEVARGVRLACRRLTEESLRIVEQEAAGTSAGA